MKMAINYPKGPFLTFDYEYVKENPGSYIKVGTLDGVFVSLGQDVVLIMNEFGMQLAHNEVWEKSRGCFIKFKEKITITIDGTNG